jgi:hypothetical protein
MVDEVFQIRIPVLNLPCSFSSLRWRRSTREEPACAEYRLSRHAAARASWRRDGGRSASVHAGVHTRWCPFRGCQ